MLDERIRIQESYEMSLDTARQEGIELEKRQLVHTMFSNGASADMIAQLTGLSLDQVQNFLHQDLTQ